MMKNYQSMGGEVIWEMLESKFFQLMSSLSCQKLTKVVNICHKLP